MKKEILFLLIIAGLLWSCKKKSDNSDQTSPQKNYVALRGQISAACHVKFYDNNNNLIKSYDETEWFGTNPVPCTQNKNVLTATISSWDGTGSITVTINPNNTLSVNITNYIYNDPWGGSYTGYCSVVNIPSDNIPSEPSEWILNKSYPNVNTFVKHFLRNDGYYNTYEFFEDNSGGLDQGSFVDLYTSMPK